MSYLLMKKKICIATSEFYGFYKNGGIATANYGIAKALVKGGCDVTILLTDSSAKCSNDNLESFLKIGIKFEVLEPASDIRVNESKNIRHLSYSFHKWLQLKIFDIVISDDYNAIAYYALMAKICGYSHVKTKFLTVVHGPRDWLLKIQEECFENIQQAIEIDMERFVIERSDHSVFVSDYIKKHLTEQGYVISDTKSTVLRYPGHAYDGFVWNNNDKIKPVKSLAFFGRQELRKGLLFFLDVLVDLSRRGYSLPVHFLGRFSKIYDYHTALIINNALKNTNHEVYIHTDLDSYECLTYLSDNKCLAVIPSLSDNLPNTVDECIAHKIPFITSTNGGQTELISKEMVNDVAIPLDVKMFTDKIIKIVESSASACVRPKLSFNDVQQKWIALIESLCAEASSIIEYNNREPLVSICVVHFDQPDLLRQTLTGIEAQTYKNTEVILVDDGSTTTDAIELINSIEKNGGYGPIPIKVLRQNNKYLGRARNYALENSKGLYVVFMDDDNYAHPAQVSELVRAINTSSAKAVSLFAYFNPLPTIPDLSLNYYVDNLPLGSGKLSGKFANTFGDSNSIFDIEFLKQIGGFFEDKGLPFEDWHCFSKIISNGGEVLVLPAPLMYYRIRKNSMLRTTPALRALRHIVSTSIVEGSNVDPVWVQKYTYEKSHLEKIRSSVHWQKIVREKSEYNTALAKKINSEIDPNSPKVVNKINKFFSECTDSRVIHFNNQDYNHSFIGDFNKSIDGFKNSLRASLNLISQLGTRSTYEKYKSVTKKPKFQIDISSIKYNEHVFLHSPIKIPGTNWDAFECRWDGLFFHTLTTGDVVIEIPNCVTISNTFIRCSVKRLDPNCRFGKVKLFVVPSSLYINSPAYQNSFLPDRYTYTKSVVDFSENYSEDFDLVIDVQEVLKEFSGYKGSYSLVIFSDKVENNDYGHVLISAIDIF